MDLIKKSSWTLTRGDCWICDKHVFGIYFYSDKMKIDDNAKILTDEQLEELGLNSMIDRPSILGPFNEYIGE